MKYDLYIGPPVEDIFLMSTPDIHPMFCNCETCKPYHPADKIKDQPGRKGRAVLAAISLGGVLALMYFLI